MGAKGDLERAERRGCCCAVFVTEAGGTQRGSYTRCLEHKRTAKENRDGEP